MPTELMRAYVRSTVAVRAIPRRVKASTLNRLTAASCASMAAWAAAAAAGSSMLVLFMLPTSLDVSRDTRSKEQRTTGAAHEGEMQTSIASRGRLLSTGGTAGVDIDTPKELAVRYHRGQLLVSAVIDGSPVCG